MSGVNLNTDVRVNVGGKTNVTDMRASARPTTFEQPSVATIDLGSVMEDSKVGRLTSIGSVDASRVSADAARAIGDVTLRAAGPGDKT